MHDYQQGKVYKVLNTIDNETYVVSTCEVLSQRMARHRSQVKFEPHYKLYKHMHELGVEPFYIELIEDYPSERNEQVVKREGEIIRSLGALNTCGTIDIKESKSGYHRQYHHDNLEQRKEQNTYGMNKTRNMLRTMSRSIMKTTRKVLRMCLNETRNVLRIIMNETRNVLRIIMNETRDKENNNTGNK